MIRAEVRQDAASIRKLFQSAEPFRHAVIDDFLETSTADALLEDFPAFDPRKAMNEHGEVGRKAVFETVTDISPGYRRFYEYINSRSFLETMSALTGIEDLVADETLFGGGTHENLDGQSLDVHVDFNIDERRMLHRRVNLLIYLNREWEASWGGAIELHADPWNLAGNTMKSFLPLFNRALVFETNEYSWHGFQRIMLPQDRKQLSRKSFSIYLYTKERPIEETVAPHTTFYVPRSIPAHLRAGATLTDRDEEELRIAIASRDGLLRMYQKLLVEKEQRLRDLMEVRRASADAGEAMVLSPRVWRVIGRLRRARARLSGLVSRVRFRRH